MLESKFFVGQDLTGFADNGEQLPISRVTLMVDAENSISAGDDSGMELLADCQHATKEIVESILASVKGKTYRMFTAENTRLDPSAELGDGITAGGVYSVISRLSEDGGGFPSVTAPGEDELEDEYPISGSITQSFNRQIAGTRSSITKTAKEIRLEISDLDNNLRTEISQTKDEILLEVSGQGGELSIISQTVDEISHEIYDSDGKLATSLTQTANSITATVKGYLTEYYRETETFVESITNNLQAQIDGQIETWYHDYGDGKAGTPGKPTLWNYPAEFWRKDDPSETEKEYQRHIGDLAYNKTTGQVYRFFYDDGEWKWILIQDNAIAEALAAADKAQDTADGKRRVFTDIPYPPYDVGDLWVNANYGNEIKNEIMRCKIGKDEEGSFSITDWEKASKYTDDSELNNFITTTFDVKVGEIAGKIETSQGDITSIREEIGKISLSVESASLGSKASITLSVGDKTQEGEIDLSNVREAFQDDNSEIKIEAGKVSFYTGTFTLSSGNINIDENGVLTTTDGNGSTTISSGSVITQSLSKDKIIETKDGFSYYYNGGKFIGNLGNNIINGTSNNGIVFDLAYTGDFMAWASKTSAEDNAYTLKMLYANKDIYAPIDESTYRLYSGDCVTLSCDECIEGQLYFGENGSNYSTRIYRGKTSGGSPDFVIRSSDKVFIISEKDLYLQPSGAASISSKYIEMKTDQGFHFKTGESYEDIGFELSADNSVDIISDESVYITKTTSGLYSSYIRLYDDGDATFRAAGDITITSVNGDVLIKGNDVLINGESVAVDSMALNIGTTPIVSDSDIRLKSNIKESEVDALSVLNNIRLYSFDWELTGKHRNIGFISQQIEAEASADFIQHDERDDTYRIKETYFIPYLVKAVQQLYNMIAPQKAIPLSLMSSTKWKPEEQYTDEEKQAYLYAVRARKEEQRMDIEAKAATKDVTAEREEMESGKAVEIKPVTVS